MSLGDKYKLAKNAGKRTDNKKTSYTTDRAHRGRPIEPPKMEPTAAEKREAARQRRNEAAMSRARIADQKAAKKAKADDRKAKRIARKTAALARKAAKAATNKDAKKYKK